MKKIACLAALSLHLVGCANGINTYNTGTNRAAEAIHVKFLVKLYGSNGILKSNNAYAYIEELNNPGRIRDFLLKKVGCKLVNGTNFVLDSGSYYNVVTSVPGRPEEIINFAE